MRTLLSSFLLLFAFGTAHAQELQVWFIDVDQGDSTLVIGPTGKTFLFDAGDNGDGYSVVRPKLQSLGISHLDIVSASHYHADHVGGLDEVWNSGIRATVCYDRGDSNHNGTQSFYDYRSAYSSVRQTVTPGMVVDLGGGATMTCICVEGEISNGQSVNISGSSQFENSCSIAWKVEYGDFDMWLGGDLTGGGNGTTDVETKAGQACGDVDVYQCNHHCSRTSSNYNFMNSIQPEFVIVPCGHNNGYGYPKQEVVDRMNKSSRAIPVWSLTDGVGTEGYVNVNGDVHLTTDGNTYSVVAESGQSFVAHCDEQAPSTTGIADLVVSEFLADPSRVNDSDGEWVELAGARTAEPVSLNGVRMTGSGGNSVTLATTAILEAGDELTLGADGLPSRNGSYAPFMVWPTGTFSMTFTDSIELMLGSTQLDAVSFSSSWPHGSGVSAERKDLLSDGQSSNFAAATTSFGLGDKGTPNEDNAADTTQWGGGSQDSWIELITPAMLGGRLEMNWHCATGENAAGALYQGFLTQGTTPGITVNGVHIPANLDTAYSMTNTIPGWSGFVPSNEVIAANVNIPNNGAWRGMTIYAIFVTYKNIAGYGLDVRTVADPVAMILW